MALAVYVQLRHSLVAEMVDTSILELTLPRVYHEEEREKERERD